MIELPKALFETALPGLGRALSGREGRQASNYLKTLIKWQKTQRLVGSTKLPWLVENVIVDSLLFLAALPQTARTVADLGSGAGIPGIMLAIVRPEVTFELIESRQKRVSFLSSVVRELELSNVRVTGERAEALVPSRSDAFDAIVMRCAGDLGDLVDIATSMLRAGGVLIVSGKPGDKGDVVVERSGKRRTFRVIPRPPTMTP